MTKATPPARADKAHRRRQSKREALLAGAATLFNTRGIAGTSLADVAEAVGLTRAAVYYYVDDRAELVFQCYSKSCDLTADDLANASQGANGLERVLAFVRCAFAPERPQVAVLNDINALGEPLASMVRAADDRNTTALIGFVREGVADGSVRDCDSEIAAQSLIGMINFARLSPLWGGGASRTYRIHLRDAVLALVEHGIAAGPVTFDCPLDADAFLPERFNAFDRRRASELKQDQLLAQASRRFNRDGIEATSIDEIAAEIGATKGAVYHYVKDKPDLVVRCYERAFDIYERIGASGKEHGRNGLERGLLITHLFTQAILGPVSPLMAQPGLEDLPDERRQAVQNRAAGMNRLSSRFLREGMADGSCRPCDARNTTHVFAGAFGWLPKWVRADDPRPPRQFADEICNLLASGLAGAPTKSKQEQP
jgi:AcrR family transcriptional regulator